MIRRKTRNVALLIALATVSVAFAQTGGGYDLSWNTVDGGGETCSTGGGSGAWNMFNMMVRV